MVLTKPGMVLIYNGVEYTVGASVIATDQSVYRGLYGKITEIRSDGDKETDNVGPDIYCAFEQPVLHDEIIALEKSFSTLYGAPRSMDDIIFDPVIMAPEMVQQLEGDTQDRSLTVYRLVEAFSLNGERNYSEELFTDPAIAQFVFQNRLSKAANSDWMVQWRANTAFESVEEDELYDCFLEGEYCLNHYCISLSQLPLTLNLEQFKQLGEEYIAHKSCMDFEMQAEQLPDADELTDEQFGKMLADPEIPALINKELQKNDAYWRIYWDCVNSVARILIDKYLEEPQAAGGAC